MSGPTTDSAETLAEVWAKHQPVVGRFAHLNAIVGCQCMDRVFVAGQETYPDHLAATLIASDWMKRHDAKVRAEGAAEEREGWIAYLESWASAVGAAPFTAENVLRHMRGAKPWGCCASQGVDQ